MKLQIHCSASPSLMLDFAPGVCQQVQSSIYIYTHKTVCCLGGFGPSSRSGQPCCFDPLHRHSVFAIGPSFGSTGVAFLGPGLHLARAYSRPGPTLGPGLLSARAYTWPGPTLGPGLHLARAYTWLGPTLGPGLHLARAYTWPGLTLGPGLLSARAYTWHGSL